MVQAQGSGFTGTVTHQTQVPRGPREPTGHTVGLRNARTGAFRRVRGGHWGTFTQNQDETEASRRVRLRNPTPSRMSIDLEGSLIADARTEANAEARVAPDFRNRNLPLRDRTPPLHRCGDVLLETLLRRQGQWEPQQELAAAASPPGRVPRECRRV